MFLGAMPQNETFSNQTIVVVEDNTAPDIALQTEVLNDITANGRPCIYSRTTGQNYDPTTGDLTPGTTTAWAISAVQMEYSTGEIDGELIQRGDAQFLLAGLSPEPLIDDTMDFAGVVWRVVNVATLQPQGYPLLYTIQGRK